MADVLQLVPQDRYGRVGVERRRADGCLASAECRTFRSDRDFALAAKALGVPKDLLVQAVDRFRRDNLEDRVMLTDKPAFECWVRGRREPAGCGERFDSVSAALAVPPAGDDAMVRWEGTTEWAVLDVDGAGGEWLFRECLLARPTAGFAWRSHHGGVHLLYRARGGFEAGELAAAAALSVLAIYPAARCELKADTRHPRSRHPDGALGGDVEILQADLDLGRLAAAFDPRDAGSDEAAEWLAERDMEVGRRYEHDKCPRNPSSERLDTRPVEVRDEGVKCYRCEGTGQGGWWTWAQLVGGRSGSLLSVCVAQMTHWDHARHVVAGALGLEGSLAKAAYAAVLKLRHPEDARAVRAMWAGRDLARFDRSWVNLQGEAYHVMGKGIRAMLSELPAARRADDSLDDAAVERLEQPTDLLRVGYPSLHPVWSVRIHGQHLADPDATSLPVVVQCSYLASPLRASLRARYVPGADPDWAPIEALCPGLDRRAVELLIAAKGCAEAGVGMHPFVFLTGPTGSGKTTTVELAAGICGDQAAVVPWVDDRDRLRAAVRSAKEQGSYCCFDEVGKGQRALGRRGTRSLDFVLTMTADSVSHKLYTGPVRMGDPPVVVFADTAVPGDVKGDAQLARRLVHAPLVGRKDWKQQRVGLGLDLSRLRLAGLAPVCDSVLSSVIDRFFRRRLTFEAIAAELGFRTLERTDEAELEADVLRELFEACCAAQEMAPSAQRMSARGWRRVEKGGHDRLSQAWDAVCDADDFASSRPASAADWQQLCGLSAPCEFEAHKAAGGAAKIRFVNKDASHYRFGEDLRG